MGVTESYAGWTPIRLSTGPAGLDIDWCYTDGLPCDDPFFDQTIERCLRRPARLLFRRHTGADVLHAVAAERQRRPDGLVLHMSRCGSTLVSSMLTARGDTLAVSEPGPIDSAVRVVAAGAAGPDLVTDMFSAVGGLCGDRRYVVKCDAWSVLDADVLAAALPDVPWVFVHRDPVEVLVSQLRRRGYHMIPGTLPAAVLDIDEQELSKLTAVEYPALVLGRIVAAAAAAVKRAGERAIVVDHADLPHAVTGIAAHFGLADGAEVTARMFGAADMDAKNPHQTYVDDRERKQRDAPSELREAVDRWVRPAYDDLLATQRAVTA